MAKPLKFLILPKQNWPATSYIAGEILYECGRVYHFPLQGASAEALKIQVFWLPDSRDPQVSRYRLFLVENLF